MNLSLIFLQILTRPEKLVLDKVLLIFAPVGKSWFC